ncbi:MAG: metal-dependent hydrolase, partial [Thermomicrobiales bacterium]
MRLTYFGHSAFQLDDGENTVLIDPFISGNDLTNQDPSALSPGSILLTHAHDDHVGDTVAIATRCGAAVVATFELANWAGSQGVSDVRPGNHGGTVAFPGGTAKFTPAWHTSSRSDWSAPGVPAGLVVRFGGKTIYFAGDTALFGDM